MNQDITRSAISFSLAKKSTLGSQVEIFSGFMYTGQRVLSKVDHSDTSPKVGNTCKVAYKKAHWVNKYS